MHSCLFCVDALDSALSARLLIVCVKIKKRVRVCVCVVRLTEVSAAVRGALEGPGSVQHVNTLLREFSLQRSDLQTILQLVRTLAH